MDDALRLDYDLSTLKGAVRGKYRNAGVNQVIATVDSETPVIHLHDPNIQQTRKASTTTIHSSTLFLGAPTNGTSSQHN